MNMQIILASLKARPVRTGVSVLAVALEVTLILVLVGLTTGVVDETGKRVAGVGADLIFQPPDSSFVLALNTAVLPVEVKDRIAAVEGVQAVAPILTLVNPGKGLNLIYGIDPASFDAASGGFTYLEGAPFTKLDEALIDDWYAADQNLHVGSEITMLNQKFKVAGIVENGKGARVFIPIEKAQSMNGREGKASLFYIKLKDRSQIKEVMARMGPGTDFEGNKITDVQEFASLMFAENSSLMDSFFRVIVFVGVCIGVLVIFLSMYTTITERTREIGILRSLGASKTFIVILILQESILLCIGGIILGIGASFIAGYLIKAIFPTQVVVITTAWLIKATMFAILSGIIGSLYPSVKAAAKDPVEALAYE